MSLRPLAYAKQVSARIASGERVGLLVVSLHCWSSGDWFMHRDDVARVVLPSDLPVERADWSIALARDVVVCGPVPEGQPLRLLQSPIADCGLRIADC
jgi:hypothetical protein